MFAKSFGQLVRVWYWWFFCTWAHYRCLFYVHWRGNELNAGNGAEVTMKLKELVCYRVGGEIGVFNFTERGIMNLWSQNII